MKFYQWKWKRLSGIIKSQQEKKGQSESVDTQHKSMKIILTKKGLTSLC